MSLTIVKNATCTFCGCVCDDIELHADGVRIVETKRACSLGESWFKNHTVERLYPDALINGQPASVDDAEKAVKLALAQYKAGTVDFTRVTQVEQALVQQQDTLMQALGEIATGLIQVYKALGGGWLATKLVGAVLGGLGAGAVYGIARAIAGGSTRVALMAPLVICLWRVERATPSDAAASVTV